MKYFCIHHFFVESEANKQFEELTKDFEEEKNKDYKRYASKNEYWIALKETADAVITLITDLQVATKDFCTCIEYEYADGFSFEVQDVLPNRFKLSFRKEEEEKWSEFIANFIYFSNFTFLIQNFHKRSNEASEEISNEVDNKIKYNWRIPENFGEEFLSELEHFLDVCGRNYSKIESNYNLALTHLKNIKIFKRDIIKLVGVNIDISPIQKIVDEISFDLMNSKIIYERIKDMKDIAIGTVEVKNMKSSMQLQKELLGLQRHSITIQHATIIIEAFIVYAYTFTVWKSVNEEGFKHSSLLMKYMIPLFIALGVVLFVEFLKDLKIGFLKDLKRLKYIFFVFLALGIYLISR